MPLLLLCLARRIWIFDHRDHVSVLMSRRPGDLGRTLTEVFPVPPSREAQSSCWEHRVPAGWALWVRLSSGPPVAGTPLVFSQGASAGVC